MIRAEPTKAETQHVVANLRDLDREEIEATSWDLGQNYVHSLQMIRAFQYVAYAGDDPAAIFGAWPHWPGVWNVYAFGTDAFPARSLTKFIRRSMIPTLLEMGAHRADCASLDSHHVAHRWLERLGARRESVMPGFGKNGETFIRYVWHVQPPEHRHLDR